MLKNYIKTAINSLKKHKFFSVINITGLTLGIAASLLILVYVVNELSYERFQKNRNNIYRIVPEWGSERDKMKFAGSMPALAPAIKAEIPGVISAIRIRKDYEAVIKDSENREIPEKNLFFADPGIFDVFSFYLEQVDQADILNDPFTAVISETAALKYFGNSDPLGKELSYNDTPVKIEGVMRDIPDNTHLKCDLIVSYSTLKALGRMPEKPWNNWGDDLTYILLGDNVPVNSIVPKLEQLLSANAGEWFAARMKLNLQPLNAIHWETGPRGDIGIKGNKTYVYIFLSSAIFVLVIACFNYLNLSVSGYLERMKEVAVRKTYGAMRRQVIARFITESVIVTLISGLLSVFLFEQFYSGLYSYLGATYVLGKIHFTVVSVIVFIIVIIAGIVAGAYPAFYISRFTPIEIFRKEPHGSAKKLTLRKMLIITQFAISVVLMSGTIIIFRQLDYMKNTDLGFNKENVVLLNFPGSDTAINAKYDVLREELLKNANIRYVSGVYTVPGINSRMNISVKPDTAPADYSANIQALPVDYGFVKSMGLEIVEGRDFSMEFAADKYESAILNQSAVTFLGLKNPVGARLMIPGDEYKNGVRVIGVVKDFHVQSLREQINPVLIYINPKMFISVALRLNPADIDATLGYVQDTWKSVLPDVNPEYRYLEDAYYNLYSSEVKSGFLLSLFTTLALFISCLGLFGFASLVTGRRTREVGIRKAMGGQASGISLLLMKQYAIWIIISGLIACPVAVILANMWLRSFAFHIDISWWIFPVAICFELILVIMTIGWQSWRAAARNPVEALRYE